jgi:hypothetical protein
MCALLLNCISGVKVCAWVKRKTLQLVYATSYMEIFEARVLGENLCFWLIYVLIIRQNKMTSEKCERVIVV